MYQRLGIHGWKLFLTKLYVAAPKIEPSCGLESDELQGSCVSGRTGSRLCLSDQPSDEVADEDSLFIPVPHPFVVKLDQPGVNYSWLLRRSSTCLRRQDTYDCRLICPDYTIRSERPLIISNRGCSLRSRRKSFLA